MGRRTERSKTFIVFYRFCPCGLGVLFGGNGFRLAFPPQQDGGWGLVFQPFVAFLRDVLFPCPLDLRVMWLLPSREARFKVVSFLNFLDIPDSRRPLVTEPFFPHTFLRILVVNNSPFGCCLSLGFSPSAGGPYSQ